MKKKPIQAATAKLPSAPAINAPVVTHSQFDSLPATAYIRQSQLIPDVVPFSSATLWRGVKSGKFPKPVKLTERVTAWKVGAIREWLSQREGV